MDVNICIPVLKRYDLLKKLLLSLHDSSVMPDKVVIIDNGMSNDSLLDALLEAPCRTEVHTPDRPLGVAESWNWFIKNVTQERIITNDDIEFSTNSLYRMLDTSADLVWTEHGFSCFLLRDACVRKIGLFDEAISPGYGYYEDCDYQMRIDGRGTRKPVAVAATVDAHLAHARSATLTANSDEEMEQHHRKFRIAQRNYMAKWGLTTI